MRYEAFAGQGGFLRIMCSVPGPDALSNAQFNLTGSALSYIANTALRSDEKLPLFILRKEAILPALAVV